MAAMPLQRGNLHLSDKTKQLEHKFGEARGPDTLFSVAAYPSPPVVLGGFRKKS